MQAKKEAAQKTAHNDNAKVQNSADIAKSEWRKFSVFVANTAKTKKYQQRDVTWPEFVGQILRLDNPDEAATKDGRCYVGGTLKDGIRGNANVLSRSLITIDIDDASGDEEFEIDEKFGSRGWACVVHTTFSSTPQNPRFRFIMPTDREMTAAEWEAITRWVASQLCDKADGCSFTLSQTMYCPRIPKGGRTDYFRAIWEGKPLPVDEVLGMAGTSPMPSKKTDEGSEAVKSAARMGDPRHKTGNVGLFCRAFYPIEDAITDLLPDIYTPTRQRSRFTYSGGTTEGGMVCYDGLFAFSNHDHDPASRQACNVFDLVRIHRFGNLDTDPHAAVGHRESDKAMQTWMEADPAIRKRIEAQRQADAPQDFESIQEDEDTSLLDGIENWITEYAAACAQCFSVPRGMIDTAMMAVASSSIGDKVHVKDGAFDTNLSLWCVIIAPSGAGKTPTTDEVMKPVKRMQAAQYDIYQTMMAGWKALPKKEREVQAPPIFSKRYISDTTPESLYLELSRHADGLLLYRDEIAGWVKDFGRYNHSGEIENLLSIFSGQPITITRKTQDPVVVGNPFLSILGGIQPGAAKKVFANEDFADSGFLGRFLWSFPSCDIREDYYQQSIDKGLQTLWSDAVAYMCGLPKIVITLSDSALVVKRDFYKETVRKLKSANNANDTFMSGMYGKFPTHADRIAGVLHVLANIGVSPLPSYIGGETYAKAVRAMSRFEAWGKKVGTMYGGGHRITQEDAILSLHRVCPILNQSKFAEAIGKTQQYVNKVLNKLRL